MSFPRSPSKMLRSVILGLLISSLVALWLPGFTMAWTTKPKTPHTLLERMPISTTRYSTVETKDISESTISRRGFFVAVTAVSTASLGIVPSAYAKKPPPMSVNEAVEAVRIELQEPQGSLSRLQNALDANDFAALMEATKTMDQALRKRVVGQAKYYWKDQNLATQLSNSITFDLIGINRNARPGQENADGVQQYLTDLRKDLQTILKNTQEAAAQAASEGWLDAME